MPGPFLRWERIESVADAGGEAVEVVAVQARQEGVGGQRRAEGVCVAGMGPGAGRVERDVGDAGLRRDGVVPLAVELVGADGQGGRVLPADLDPRGVAAGVQAGGDGQSGAGGGGGDQVEGDVVAGQRAGTPVRRDEGEQAVLDPVPLRCSQPMPLLDY